MTVAALFAAVAMFGAEEGGVPETPMAVERPRHSLQYDVGVVPGIAFHLDYRGDMGFAIGIRPETLLFRRSDKSRGIGVYGEALTTSFGGAQFGGGILLYSPMEGRFGATVSGGLFMRENMGEGAVVGLFLGKRNFNSRTHFDGATGVRLEGRFDLRGTREGALLMVWQTDLTRLVALALKRDTN